MPEPAPPIVNEGRTTTGYPNSCTAARQSDIEWQTTDRALSAPMAATISLNRSRFSPASIASTDAPISSTPYFSSTPEACRSMAAFKAVCPPRVASTASGRSFAMTLATISGVIGST